MTKLYNQEGQILFEDEEFVGPFENKKEAQETMSIYEGLTNGEIFWCTYKLSGESGWWFIAHAKFVKFDG